MAVTEGMANLATCQDSPFSEGAAKAFSGLKYDMDAARRRKGPCLSILGGIWNHGAGRRGGKQGEVWRHRCSQPPDQGKKESHSGLQSSEMMEWSRRSQEQWCPTHCVTCILKMMWLVATWISFPGIFSHCLRKGRGWGNQGREGNRGYQGWLKQTGEMDEKKRQRLQQ